MTTQTSINQYVPTSAKYLGWQASKRLQQCKRLIKVARNL